jgi:hypothetical protein
LTSPTLDPRNPEMDLDQRSRFNLDSMAAIKSRFCISRFWNSCCIISFPLDVVIHETSIRTGINGPDSILIQWLRLNRDFTYRDFGILVALFLFPLHVAIRETPIWSWINGPDLILIQQLRLSRMIFHIVKLGFLWMILLDISNS